MELSLAKPAALVRKPSLLKDYLLDDLSSCSSNGFRSYPRRQCCTSVRFLVEADLKAKPPKYIKKPRHRSPSTKTPFSAFQRASTAVINAVKSSSSLSHKLKLSLLTRSLSRKLLKRSFWKKPDRKEIQHWEPSHDQVDLIKNSPPPSDFPVSPNSGDSLSSSSESNCKSNSWSDSDFTVSGSDVSSSGGNSTVEKLENLNQDPHDVVSTRNLKKRLPRDKAVSGSKRVGVTVGGDDATETEGTASSTSSTSTNNLTECQNGEEEKEQFSPVSVLDCPFDDDDEDEDEVSSPFQHRLARMEGTKKRLMRKMKKFERLTQLAPVNLQNRIMPSESDPDSDRSPRCHSSESAPEDFIDDSEEEENPAAAAAADVSFKLLQLAKSTMPSICSMNPKADYDKFLLDFFQEGMEPGNAGGIVLDHHELLMVAKDWMVGQPRELFMGWEVQKNREAYVRDIERTGNWRNVVNEERQEVALELEAEVFASLVNELCHDLLSSGR